ncbi:MAG: hypothetical protein R2756_13905 [Bacteroidales bacterium]
MRNRRATEIGRVAYRFLPYEPSITETVMVQRKWLDNLFYGVVWSLLKQRVLPNGPWAEH